MRCIKFLILIAALCACQKKDISDVYPPYKTIVNASEKLEKESGLILVSYGVNLDIKKKYSEILGIDDFSASFRVEHSRYDTVSRDKATELIRKAVDQLILEINSDEKIRDYLSHYPMTVHDLEVYVSFLDDLRIPLAQGVAEVILRRGKIKYQGYHLIEYTGTYPARGKFYDMHEEAYEEVL